MSSLHRGYSGPLLYAEEADSFSVQEREREMCLLYRKDRVSLCYTSRRECLSSIKGGERLLLVAKESVYLFPIERMTYSFFLYRRLFSSSLQRGSHTPSLYRGESVLSTQRRECRSAISNRGNVLL